MALQSPCMQEDGLNFVNRTIFEGDNLAVMEGFNSNTIDLIYLDPPFNTHRVFKSNAGRRKAEVSFDDVWSDTGNITGWDDEWIDRIACAAQHVDLHPYLCTVKSCHGDKMYHYLVYMAVRLIEIQRILKPRGSVYYHCNTSAGHYVKLMLDIVFGRSNFKNEVVWKSDTGKKNNTTTRFGRAHDTIFFYAYPGATFNPQYSELTQEYIDTWYTMQDEDGRRYTARSLTRHNIYEYEFLGVTRRWECPPEQMEEYLRQGRYRSSHHYAGIQQEGCEVQVVSGRITRHSCPRQLDRCSGSGGLRHREHHLSHSEARRLDATDNPDEFQPWRSGA